MNFEKIPPVTEFQEILDLAFRKARVKGKQKKLAGNWLQVIRKKESLKLDIVKDSIETSLGKIIAGFPEFAALPGFYLKLMELTLDQSQLKKSLRSVNWALEKNRALHRQYVGMINKEVNRSKISSTQAQYYGRVSSILKQIGKQLQYLEACRKIMRSYPDIKEMFTICIYGFPNVGKTTLLNRLASTKAKVAAYAFTTKSINTGYLAISGTKVQVLDVPGMLAREKMNPMERQAQLAVEELADLIIYVYDVTESCGYSLEQQQQLRQQLTGKEVLTYLSKEDLLTETEKKKIKNKLCTLEEIKAEIAKHLFAKKT